MRRNKQARRVIAEAADVIERDGLAKGELGYIDGPKCIIGAISYVISGTPRNLVGGDLDLYYKAVDIVSAATPSGSAVSYSDRHTKDEVVKFLRKVAK